MGKRWKYELSRLSHGKQAPTLQRVYDSNAADTVDRRKFPPAGIVEAPTFVRFY